MTETAKAAMRGRRHAIRPDSNLPWSYCGYRVTWDLRSDVDPDCKWCRDRLGLDAQAPHD